MESTFNEVYYDVEKAIDLSFKGHFVLKFYDYLMVAKLPTTYPVQVGDVIRFESNVVEGNFIVNKLANLSGDNYAYMFTEFDNAILKELTASFSVSCQTP